MFMCGGGWCDGTTHECRFSIWEGTGETVEDCLPLPSQCLTDRTCACLEMYGGADALDCKCQEDANGNFFECSRIP